MRALFAIVCAGLLGSCAGAQQSALSYVPQGAFAGFIALAPPREKVPVGALWVDGQGPSGEGVADGELETIRSLTALTTEKNLQVEAGFGFLELVGIDPKLRKHYLARFSDLSLVRLKDVSGRLSTGKPHVVEALKAGTITVTSDLEIGLGADKSGTEGPLRAKATGTRSSSLSIEGHDLFIAVKVARN